MSIGGGGLILHLTIPVARESVRVVFSCTLRGFKTPQQQQDRLISASLRAYDGAERDQVVNLFNSFAMFPEDVPIPRGLFRCVFLEASLSGA